MRAVPEPSLAGRGEHGLALLPRMANRHGRIDGGTGPGKTVTVRALAAATAGAAVPADVPSAPDAAGSQLGRQIPRGVLGSILGGRR